jgi:tRNA-specific 2-thiouridylase
VELLKVGRHFRLSKEAKLIVRRNEDENDLILAFVEQDDIVMQAKDYAGPTCILRSKKKNDKSILNISAGILLRCSDAPRQNKSKVIVVINGNVKKEISTNSYK